MENKEIIENAKRLSQETLNKGEEIIPICLAFHKDKKEMHVIGVPFKNGQEKEVIRKFLREHLLKMPLEKYAIIFDVKMTAWDIKEPNKKPSVIDAVMVSIYTAQDKLTQVYPYYKERKLMENEMMEIKGRGIGKDKLYDCWDIWGEEVPFDTEERALIQRTIEKGYREFKQRVADGRGKDTAYVETVAQGKVFTGTQALSLGLVDELGGLENAIAFAAKKANLKEYSIKEYPIEKDFATQISEAFGEAKANTIKEELGVHYEIYKTLKTLQKGSGIQMRLPYELGL
jgi:hypothetical protein